MSTPENILGQLLRDLGAPILSTAVKTIIRGPLGEAGGDLASGVVKGLADAFGAPEATPEAVTKAIQEKPPAEASAIVRNYETTQAEPIMSEIEARLADVADARDTTVQLVREGSAIAWGPAMYSASIVASFNLVLFWLLFQPVHVSDAAGSILTILLGVLTREMGTVGSYFLGSSQTSREKDATIRGALESAGAPIGRAVGQAIAAGVKK